MRNKRTNILLILSCLLFKTYALKGQSTLIEYRRVFHQMMIEHLIQNEKIKAPLRLNIEILNWNFTELDAFYKAGMIGFRVQGSDFGDYVYLWVKSKHYVINDSTWWNDIEVLKYDESSLKDLFAQTVSAMTGFNREGSLIMIPAVKKQQSGTFGMSDFERYYLGGEMEINYKISNSNESIQNHIIKIPNTKSYIFFEANAGLNHQGLMGIVRGREVYFHLDQLKELFYFSEDEFAWLFNAFDRPI